MEYGSGAKPSIYIYMLSLCTQQSSPGFYDAGWCCFWGLCIEDVVGALEMDSPGGFPYYEKHCSISGMMDIHCFSPAGRPPNCISNLQT